MSNYWIPLISLFIALPVAAQNLPLPTSGSATLHRDVDGIVHIIGQTERDVLYAQGWAHARDRFFQMDSLRRQASGTLAELLGPSVLGDDVQLRTLGLRRAAERSLTVLSAESLTALQDYADGVNAWLQTHPLPSEYAALELTAVHPWEPLDSATIAKLLAFGLSFDIDVGLTTALLSYQQAGQAGDFDGDALFFEDMYRTAPFDPASTVPDSIGAAARSANETNGNTRYQDFDSSYLRSSTVAGAAEFFERLSQVPIIGDALHKREGITGSNEWGVSGEHTASGRPMIANDPHLSLDQPATFYQNHLLAPRAGIDVIGSSFAGVPMIVLGQNRHISWGATTNPMDVTDTFQETLGFTATGLGTVTNGVVEPLEVIPLVFRANQLDGTADNVEVVTGPGIEPAALIVPRRNNGPIISADIANLSAVSVQYTGFGATREIDTFRAWNLAQNIDDFIAGLQMFDFGSQNWAYADIDGNLAYFTSGELPLREDLQAGTVDGLPPYFIRNGTGGNEWLPVSDPEPDQATPNAVLPFEEMPKLINPASGFFVNANNDPAGNTLDNDALNESRPGGGIFYLNPGYAIGTRAGRISRALDAAIEKGGITIADMQSIQANVQLLDAEYFNPYIIAAFDTSQQPAGNPLLAALGADPRVAAAVERLRDWDFSTPTGIAEGYDVADIGGIRLPPTAMEIAASVNASIYSVWRSQFIANTIDQALSDVGLSAPGSAQTMSALRNLLDSFDTRHGVGVSGIDFFAVPGVTDADERLSIKILQSLVDALDKLAGPDFDAAFAGSTDQMDYRWGRLHRIVFDHPLGAPYSIPGLEGPLQPSFDDLPGFAVDGGFGAVDASSHSVRAASSNAFTYSSGPVRRYVGEPGTAPGSIVAQTILPGGSSGVLGSPWYANLMERWLTNTSYPVRQSRAAIKPVAIEIVTLDTVP